MSTFDLDEVTKRLACTTVGEEGVSFQGKSMKLDTEDDATEIVQAINACQNLHYLNLEGNTLGVDAAKAIAKALESHSEFKRALWKDLFTGRMKTEIPKALQFLGGGLVLAEARLSELDLSDNAFGPIGVDGLAVLLRSTTCQALQVLKLNNNGLGITGGRLLSKALIDCYRSSNEGGRPLALRVFIAGRNRLENEGAKALAEFFKMIGSLEELSMPQNGIYHVGITALSEALAANRQLRVLNLNDNTVTAKGAAALAKTLPLLQRLREINLGDCLLKTRGAVLLADALTENHEELEEVHLGFNEIRPRGAVAVVDAMERKPNLKRLQLGGNQLGESGCEAVRSKLRDMDMLDTLASLSEDEGEESEEEEEGEEEISESEAESDESEEESEPAPPAEPAPALTFQDKSRQNGLQSTVSVTDFLQTPTPEGFLALGNDRNNRILAEVQKHDQDSTYLTFLLELLMKVSSLSTNNVAKRDVLSCSDLLYRTLFKWAEGKDEHGMAVFSNELMVYLGLMKSEDKKKLTWNVDGCLTALNQALQQDYFPTNIKNMLEVFLARDNLLPDFPAKRTLISTLHK